MALNMISDQLLSLDKPSLKSLCSQAILFLDFLRCLEGHLSFWICSPTFFLGRFKLIVPFFWDMINVQNLTIERSIIYHRLGYISAFLKVL